MINMNYLIKLFIFLAVSCVFFSCKSKKNTIIQPVSMNAPIESEIDLPIVSFCDTIEKQLMRNADLYRINILNIDPKYTVNVIKKGEKDVYQINFDYNSIYIGFEIWFDDILFEFDYGNNCERVGDKVVCFVDQTELGNKCKGIYSTNNIYLCIYERRWPIKIRGKVCENIYGPFSKILVDVSLQCEEK